MPPPRKPAPPAQPVEYDEDEVTEFGAPSDDDALGDINFDDLDNLDMALDDGPPPSTGRYPLVVDDFEDSQVGTDVRRKLQAEKAAPEVSQGPWRERAFTPRGVMTREQIAKIFEESLKVGAMRAQSIKVEKVRGALKQEFLPVLRQAVEQAGGDGLDAWVSAITAPPGRRGKDPMLMEIGARMEKVNRANTSKEVLLAGQELAKLTLKYLATPTPPRLSLKALERELEGRIDVDTILSILFTGDGDLQARADSVDASLDQLRTQLRGMSGGNDGLMWNFSRLKVEKRVLDAEIKRRAARG